jgi:hypothetical protein
LIVSGIRTRLAVSIRRAKKLAMEAFNIKTLNEGEVKDQHQVTIKKVCSFENLRR